MFRNFKFECNILYILLIILLMEPLMFSMFTHIVCRNLKVILLDNLVF